MHLIVVMLFGGCLHCATYLPTSFLHTQLICWYDGIADEIILNTSFFFLANFIKYIKKADSISSGEKQKGEACQCEWLSPRQLRFDSPLRPKGDVLRKWLF